MAESSRSRTVYQILGWLNLAGILLILVLILHKAPAPAIPVDPAAAARVYQKLAAADQAKAAGQPAQPVTLDSTELNSYLAKSFQTSGSAPSGSVPSSASAPSAAPPADPAAALNDQTATLDQVQSSVKDVKVNMDGDLVRAYVVFDFHGKDLSLELDGHLGSQNGYLKFDPIGGKLGDMPLPQSVLQSAVDKLMASPENREKLRLPDDINDIQIANGQAVVSYK